MVVIRVSLKIKIFFLALATSYPVPLCMRSPKHPSGDHCCDIDEVRWRSPFPLEIEVDAPDFTDGRILQFSCFLVPVFQAGEQDIFLCRRYLGISAIFEIFGKICNI